VRRNPILAPNPPDSATLEQRTILAARGGDPEARAWLARHLAPVIHRFAARLLRDDHDARDAAQDALIKVLRGLDSYDERRNFRTWVLSITRNTCIDEQRRRGRRPTEAEREVACAGPSPLQEVAQAQRAARVRDALQAIPPMYREILVLYHYEHLTTSEIAETLEIPLGTVLNRMFRARQKLRDALGDEP
jgi:RNA polymerase sigma factor (sigma-70 family)